MMPKFEDVSFDVHMTFNGSYCFNENDIEMLKPEPGIYEHLLKKYSLVPEECLFYDDRQENVDAAIRMGIQSVQVTSEEMLVKELEKV